MYSFSETLEALDRGNFSLLEESLGGPAGFDRQIIKWFNENRFAETPELLAEALTCACMLNRTETARYLITKGVDPYAGMKTWLAGPHYAVSGGHLATVQMLLAQNISLEVENGYGGTLLGQALWSIVHEFRESHPAIIELLVAVGAKIQPDTVEWWEEQKVFSAEAKQRVAVALNKDR